MKIYPPLTPCLAFSVQTLGTILGLILLLDMVLSFLKGEPFSGFSDMFQTALVFVVLAGLAGLILYLILRVWAWSIEPSGITGRTYWGRRSRIAWSDVDKVAFVALGGIPALVVTSTTSKREVLAYTLGANMPEIHAHLFRHAGPDHVLTQWFRPASV